jgi:hypothetical protein
MRTPLLILGIMLIAGAVMYFISRYQSPPGEYDMLSIENKDTAISRKVRVYAANEPTEIYYLDSTWLKPDSTPLKLVVDRNHLNFMNKQYASMALILTYNNDWFYDLEIDKSDPNMAYEISFKMKPVGDTVFVEGTIDRKDGDLVEFNGPMIKMFKQFILTYNKRMPQQPADSTAKDTTTTDSTAIARVPLPNKTITVLEN